MQKSSYGLHTEIREQNKMMSVELWVATLFEDISFLSWWDTHQMPDQVFIVAVM